MSNTIVEIKSEQKDRNRLMCEYYRANPSVTYASIAENYGISRQRAKYLIERQFRIEAIKDRGILMQAAGQR